MHSVVSVLVVELSCMSRLHSRSVLPSSQVRACLLLLWFEVEEYRGRLKKFEQVLARQ